jgi:hypothetical protein
MILSRLKKEGEKKKYCSSKNSTYSIYLATVSIKAIKQVFLYEDPFTGER